jgi:phosphoglycerate dehydrogenase-like enzyme
MQMARKNIAVTFKTTPEERALFAEIFGSQAALSHIEDLSPTQRQEVLGRADVMFSLNFSREIGAENYHSLQRVRFIQLLSAGVDHMPFADLPAEVVIAGNPGAYAAPMAEHVMAMTLALAKRLSVQNEKLRQGQFDQATQNRELTDMTAGILGFGGTGRATARLMRAFGMKIHAINSTGVSSEPADFVGTLHDLERVLRASDVVVIALPLTKATRGLIGLRQLAWMKPDAILVNVARGDIVNEAALYEHARNHPAFGVGIDAWWTEPFSHGRFRLTYPFLDLPNVLGSPHNSAIVPGTRPRALRMAAENIQRYLAGGELLGRVRREDYV